MSDQADVAIVGAGTAGLAALREVRKVTEDFVLINALPWGTTCARVGCMPSKALIAAANAFHARTGMDEFGISGAAGLSADIPAVLRRVRALRDDFVAGVLEKTDELGSRCIEGHARLDGPGRLIVDGREVEARRIVLAPGSSPIVPEPWRRFGDRILTSDTLFEQEALPPRIAVVGLGAIGVELAQALSRLGIEVHGFDGGERMAGLADDDVASVVRAFLTEELPVRLGVEVDIAEADDGIAVTWEDGRVLVDRVLVAVGRRPNTEGLGLETLGVPLDDSGMPEVDPETMRVGETSVFLAGDANGMVPLLHEAADDGHIAGLNAASAEPVGVPRRIPMSVVFCDPEVATVGKIPDGNYLTGEIEFERQGRARLLQRNRGLLRVWAARDDGRLLAAQMAAPAAEHMAHLLALAIGQRMTVHDVLRMPFYHPTLEEGLRTALRRISADLPPCGAEDLAGCDPLNVDALE